MSEEKERQVYNKTVSIMKKSFISSLQFLRRWSQFPKTLYQKYPKTFSAFFIASLITAGLGYGIISKQQSLLYIPQAGYGKRNSNNPRSLIHPKNREILTEDIEIQTNDRVKIRGWHMKKQNSQRIIVYFQGNAGNIGTRIPFTQGLMNETNSDVIMVAYRGYSDSDGTPTQKGLEKDAQAILAKAIEISKRDRKPLFVFGTSLGGAVTIYVSGLENVARNISGVIVENTFTSTTDVLPYHLPLIRPLMPVVRWINRNSWPSISRISSIKSPILFIKCGQDEVVPSYMTDRLRQVCNKRNIKNYVLQFPQGRHNEVHILNPQRYFTQLVQFFGECQRQR